MHTNLVVIPTIVSESEHFIDFFGIRLCGEVRRLILCTDMAQHKVLTDDFKTWVDKLVDVRAQVAIVSDSSAVENDLEGAPGGRGGGTRGVHCAQTGMGVQEGGSLPLVGGICLNETQRASLLAMTLKCADLSGLLSDLPVANFWGRRLLEESTRQWKLEEQQRERNTRDPQQRDSVEGRGRRNVSREETRRVKIENVLLDDDDDAPDIEVEYHNGQVGFLQGTVIPMFEVYSTFTTIWFRDQVLERAGGNLAAWREGASAAARLRGDAELRRKMIKASVFCTMACALMLTRWHFFQEYRSEHHFSPVRPLPEQREGAGFCGDVSSSTCNLASSREVITSTSTCSTSTSPTTSVVELAVSRVGNEFLILAFINLLLAAGCVASVTTPLTAFAPVRSSRQHKERLLNMVGGLYVWMRIYVFYRRHTLTNLLSENYGVHNSFPFIRAEGVSSTFMQCFIVNISPVLMSFTFYRLVPHWSSRTHVVLHSIIGLIRYFFIDCWIAMNRREYNKKEFAGIFTPRSDEMVDRVEMTWLGHVLFPVVIFVLDPAFRPKMIPRWFVTGQVVSLYVFMFVTFVYYVRN